MSSALRAVCFVLAMIRLLLLMGGGLEDELETEEKLYRLCWARGIIISGGK